MKPVKTVLIVGSAAAVTFAAIWIIRYSNPGDPKDIRYILWKHGLWRLDPAAACAAMVGDPSSERLVIGKTKGELNKMFGSTTEVADASPYLKSYYESGPYRGRDVVFLSRSVWMIVFENGHAVDLVLVKGW